MRKGFLKIKIALYNCANAANIQLKQAGNNRNRYIELGVKQNTILERGKQKTIFYSVFFNKIFNIGGKL